LKIKLVEVFPSFQGEGEDSGKKMVIIRFKYCNRIYNKLTCPFCDTVQKLNSSKVTEYSLEDIQKVIDDFGPGAGILITGGEPTFSLENRAINNFNETTTLLKELNYSIANVESNGYNLIGLTECILCHENINFMYSPKVFTLNELIETKENIKNMVNIESIKFKIVYQNNDLVHNILDCLSEYKLHDRTFLMSEGKTRDELIKNSEDTLKAANKYKFNFSSRLHIIHNFT